MQAGVFAKKNYKPSIIYYNSIFQQMIDFFCSQKHENRLFSQNLLFANCFLFCKFEKKYFFDFEKKLLAS